MKLKIVSFVVIVAILSFLNTYLAEPVAVLAKNKAAVATVNGGDAAFVGQNAVNHVVATPWLGLTILTLAVVMFYSDVRKALSSNTQN
jgi:hypothetical protein